MDRAQREALERLWPFSKFPVLRDPARDRIVAESSIVIDYLTAHHPGPIELIPSDPESPARRGCVIGSTTPTCTIL